MPSRTYLVLGGGGMIGFQIAHRICRHLDPETVIIASLFQQEVREAATTLRKDFPEVNVVEFWGDVFVRSDLNAKDKENILRRSDLLLDDDRRAELFQDLFGNADSAYERSQLVQLIREQKPHVIVDAINTATAISYQDIYSASEIAKRDLASFLDASKNNHSEEEVDMLRAMMTQSVESLMISQYIPQLIRHVVMINRAMREAKTELYLKVGTTGTGGMGLNIPYTHGEDKPSARLMSKTAIAFAHTGLLFLMARTQGGPIIQELKPAALVGWSDITLRTIRRKGLAAYSYSSRMDTLAGQLKLRIADDSFVKKEKLQIVVADTGENGMFTKGEFEAITALRQMELITPEEIARAAVLEIQGINTGKDVIAAVDGSVLGPTYRGGFLRRQALDELTWLEEQTGTPSVALGELGPPELSKLLWESYLLKENYPSMDAVLEYSPDEDDPTGKRNGSARSPMEISKKLVEYLQNKPDVGDLITSVGVPILLPDGCTLQRGPFIRIPEVAGLDEVGIQNGDIETWAAKGWVDLRPENMARWQGRFREMHRTRTLVRDHGSAAVDKVAYLHTKIFIGEVVGWVFNNEMGGYRIK